MHFGDIDTQSNLYLIYYIFDLMNLLSHFYIWTNLGRDVVSILQFLNSNARGDYAPILSPLKNID